MRNVRTNGFNELFAKLPRDVREQAKEAYRIFKDNPYYPGLHFECINKEKSWYSVRVNQKYRAVGTWKDDTILWFFIGSHTKYDRLL